MTNVVAKELGEMKKAEEKEEVKGKELRAQVMAVFEEVNTNNNSGVPVSSNSSTSTSTGDFVLRSILKKDRSKC